MTTLPKMSPSAEEHAKRLFDEIRERTGLRTPGMVPKMSPSAEVIIRTLKVAYRDGAAAERARIITLVDSAMPAIRSAVMGVPGWIVVGTSTNVGIATKIAEAAVRALANEIEKAGNERNGGEG